MRNFFKKLAIAVIIGLGIASIVSATTVFAPQQEGTGTPTSGYILTSNGASSFASWQAAPGGGTVTSVGLSAPSEFTISGSPVTGSGTLTFTKVNQNANRFYAGPASGAAAAPTFRQMALLDIQIGVGSQTSNKFLASPSVGSGTPTMRTITAADIAGLTGVTSIGSSDSSLNVTNPSTTPDITINLDHPNFWNAGQTFGLGADAYNATGTFTTFSSTTAQLAEPVSGNVVYDWGLQLAYDITGDKVMIDHSGTPNSGAALSFNSTGLNSYFSGVVQVASLTASRAVATDSSKNLVSSTTTDTELGYLSGVTSAIQTQLNGKVTSVTGTTNRITSSGGTTPAIDISASYVGQSSITTLGTITAGVWNGTAIANANLANSTISGVALGGTLAALTATDTTLTFSGSYTGNTARTVGLNLGNANTWTALQTFGTGSGVLISTGAQLSINATTSTYEQFGSALASGSMALGMFNATAGTSADFRFYRSKNASVGSATVVASGDNLGTFTWYGAQQTGTFSNTNTAAQFGAEVDGTVTSGAGADMPGRLVFRTTGDSTGTLSERLRINSSGAWGLSGANFGSTGNVLSSNGSSSAVTWIAGTISGVSLGSNLNNLTATDSTLTFSASYNGSAAATVGLNLSQANTWTATPTFNAFIASNGYRSVKVDVTNATATMSNLTDLSTTTVSAKKYSGVLAIYADNSVALEGLQFDFNGGTATFTGISFGFVGTPIGSTVGTSYSTAAGTAVTVTTATVGDIVYYIPFTVEINAGGTFIPRFSEVTHTTGTATVKKYAYLKMDITN